MQVVITFSPATGNIDLQANGAPGPVIVDILLTTIKLLFAHALQAQEGKPDILIPRIKPPKGMGS